jgi:LysM domain.
MNRVKKALNNTSNLPSSYTTKDYGLSDLNWEDSGGTFTEPKKIEDPSINDYIKGYQMEPYEFKQYANKLHKVEKGDTIYSIAKKYYNDEKYAQKIVEMNDSLIVDMKPGYMLIIGQEERTKTAGKEIRDISYTPENIAIEILTLWKQVDGPLQNFFDAFTMNKTTNEMKIQIANCLASMGYNVVPVLVDETPKYASAYVNFSKLASSKRPKTIVDNLLKIFPKSKVLSKVAEEIRDLKKYEKEDVMGLLDYYKKIFPDDYANSLVDITFNNPKVSFEEFKDIQISDEALEQMEKMDSGNQNPTSKNPKDGGFGGYDFTTQMRPDGPGGVAPNFYETRANLKKK